MIENSVTLQLAVNILMRQHIHNQYEGLETVEQIRDFFCDN